MAWLPGALSSLGIGGAGAGGAGAVGATGAGLGAAGATGAGAASGLGAAAGSGAGASLGAAAGQAITPTFSAIGNSALNATQTGTLGGVAQGTASSNAMQAALGQGGQLGNQLSSTGNLGGGLGSGSQLAKGGLGGGQSPIAHNALEASGNSGKLSGLTNQGKPSQETANRKVSGGNDSLSKLQALGQNNLSELASNVPQQTEGLLANNLNSGQQLPFSPTQGNFSPTANALTEALPVNTSPGLLDSVKSFAKDYVEDLPENYARGLLSKRHTQQLNMPGNTSAVKGYTAAYSPLVGSRFGSGFGS